MPTEDLVVLDEGYSDNPHRIAAVLREDRAPRRVRMARGTDAWLVTRYEDARTVLANPGISKDAGRLGDLFRRHTDGATPVFRESLAYHMLNSDPPDHTRLRKLVSKAFTPGTTARLRPRIEAITADLLDRVERAGAGGDPVNLLEEFAFPLPLTVIGELLGIPEHSRNAFREWSSVMVSSAPREVALAAGESMSAFLIDLIARKRANPSEDLLSDLVHATDDGDRLTENELVAMAFLLLIAGHDTTVNLIGNGTLALLRAPDQLATLRGDESLLPGAIEELLRFDGPVNIATIRFTSEPIEVGGVEIPADEFVLVSLLAANRDGERFAEADELDVTRQAAGHLAFGHGIHYCVGAPLARLEARIAIGGLLNRFPDLRLAGDPGELRWRESTLMRGLTTLPIRVD